MFRRRKLGDTADQSNPFHALGETLHAFLRFNELALQTGAFVFRLDGLRIGIANFSARPSFK
jgi:hypothetical protein